MNETLIKLIIKYLAGKVDGKKTYIGATGKMLTGLGTLLTGIVGLLGYAFPDQLPSMEYEVASGLIVAGAYGIFDGFSEIGQRHATEKAKLAQTKE